jgi:hypothetical protein
MLRNSIVLVAILVAIALGGITPAGFANAAAAQVPQPETLVTIQPDSTEHIIHLEVTNPQSELLGIQVTYRDGTSEWFNQLISTINNVSHVWFYPGYTAGLEYEEITIGFDYPSVNSGSLWRKGYGDGWTWSGARLFTSTGCGREPYLRLEGANVTTPAWVVATALDGTFSNWQVAHYGASASFTGDLFEGWFTNLTGNEVAPIKGGHTYQFVVYGGENAPDFTQYQGQVYAAKATTCPATVVIMPSSSRYILDLKLVNFYEGDLPLEVRTADGVWHQDQLYLQDLRGIFTVESWHGQQDFAVRFPEGMRVENLSFWKSDPSTNTWYWNAPKRVLLPFALR